MVNRLNTFRTLLVSKIVLPTVSSRYTKLTNSTMYGTNSFRYQAAKLWNSLPEDARKIASFKLIILDSLSSAGMVKSVNVPYVCN